MQLEYYEILNSRFALEHRYIPIRRRQHTSRTSTTHDCCCNSTFCDSHQQKLSSQRTFTFSTSSQLSDRSTYQARSFGYQCGLENPSKCYTQGYSQTWQEDTTRGGSKLDRTQNSDRDDEWILWRLSFDLTSFDCQVDGGSVCDTGEQESTKGRE